MSDEFLNRMEDFVANTLARKALNARKFIIPRINQQISDTQQTRQLVDDYNSRVLMLDPNAGDQYLFDVEPLPEKKLVIRRRG